MPSNGTYDIVFTNGEDGKGTPQLEEAVDYFNRINLAVDITSITMPIATKNFINKLDDNSLKNIELIDTTLEHMEQLISDVLDYSSVSIENFSDESIFFPRKKHNKERENEEKRDLLDRIVYILKKRT